jgi:hypothetical protein
MGRSQFETKLLLLVNEEIQNIETAADVRYRKLEKSYNLLLDAHNETLNQLQHSQEQLGALRQQLLQNDMSSPILDDRFDHGVSVVDGDLFSVQQRLKSKTIENPHPYVDNVCLSTIEDKSSNRDQERIKFLSSPIKVSVTDTKIPATLTNVKLPYENNVFISPTKSLKSNSFNGNSGTKCNMPLKSKSFADVPFDKLPTQYSDNESTQISPIKISPIKLNKHNSWAKKGIKGESPESSPIKLSQCSIPFNKLPTQYSDEASPTMGDEIVQDSQDEDDILQPIPSQGSQLEIPQPNLHTTLQNREFVRKYITAKFYEMPTIKINLKINPITGSDWIISDFKGNPKFVRSGTKYIKLAHGQKRKIGLTKLQEENIAKFYSVANGGDDGPESDCDHTYEDDISQIYDKLPSPPGFMQSEFPTTQEQARRRNIVKTRQVRRIQRRVRSCLQVELGQQVGEFIFVSEILNMYVQQNRFIV